MASCAITIRQATSEDAAELCAVVRASITDLCSIDHKNDPTILEAWLANKTPENVTKWLSNSDIHLLVAELSRRICGVGCVTVRGEVVLNYVAPGARFAGVSNELLQALERRAWQDGNLAVRLDSTATARRFYRSRGYADDGERGEKFGLTTFPMIKPRP